MIDQIYYFPKRVLYVAMTVSHAIETGNIAIGMISNALLIFLSLRFSKKNLGTYKYLLMIFACYDIFLTVIHKIHDFGTIFTLYSSRFVDNTWLCPIYVSCFTVPFALTNINFLHRYWAVKKPANLKLYSSPRFACLLALYPIGECVGWSWLSYQTDLDEDHFVEKYLHDNYNWTITGFRVMHHWKYDHLNVSQFLILLCAMIVMTVNFSIAIFLATQTIVHIRVAKTFTSNYRALQIKILRALFAQASVPVLFVYIPFGCAIMFPFLKINDKFHLANLCFTFTSFFPAWDAIVVILLIKDYRDGLLSFFSRSDKASTNMTTTWKTQTTSMRLE